MFNFSTSDKEKEAQIDAIKEKLYTIVRLGGTVMKETALKVVKGEGKLNTSNSLAELERISSELTPICNYLKESNKKPEVKTISLEKRMLIDEITKLLDSVEETYGRIYRFSTFLKASEEYPLVFSEESLPNIDVRMVSGILTNLTKVVKSLDESNVQTLKELNKDKYQTVELKEKGFVVVVGEFYVMDGDTREDLESYREYPKLTRRLSQAHRYPNLELASTRAKQLNGRVYRKTTSLKEVTLIGDVPP